MQGVEVDVIELVYNRAAKTASFNLEYSGDAAAMERMV